MEVVVVSLLLTLTMQMLSKYLDLCCNLSRGVFGTFSNISDRDFFSENDKQVLLFNYFFKKNSIRDV